MPTALPTMAPGWVTLAEISGAAEGCPANGSAFLVEGIATGTCWVTNKPKASFGSLRYTCGDEFLTIEEFSSTDCSNLTGRVQYFLGCSVFYSKDKFPKDYWPIRALQIISDDDSDYAVSLSLQCSSGASLPLPSEPSGQVFSVLSGSSRRIRNILLILKSSFIPYSIFFTPTIIGYNNEEACTGLEAFTGLNQDYCIAYNFSGYEVSFKIAYPNLVFHLSRDCSGGSMAFALPSECTENPVPLFGAVEAVNPVKPGPSADSRRELGADDDVFGDDYYYGSFHPHVDDLIRSINGGLHQWSASNLVPSAAPSVAPVASSSSDSSSSSSNDAVRVGLAIAVSLAFGLVLAAYGMWLWWLTPVKAPADSAEVTIVVAGADDAI